MAYLGVIRTIEIRALAVLSWSSMITSYNEMASSIVLANNRMPYLEIIYECEIMAQMSSHAKKALILTASRGPAILIAKGRRLRVAMP